MPGYEPSTGTMFVQKGGTLMEIPRDKINDYGSTGWTPDGSLAREANDRKGITAAIIAQDQRPTVPVYNDMRDAKGDLLSKYKMEGGPAVENGYNPAAIAALHEIGLASPGSSPWEQMMLGKQGVEESVNRDKTVRGADTARLNTISQLSSSGGMSTGARERAATGSNRDMMRAVQDVNRQGTLDRYGIGVQGEENRLGVLKQLPGMELAREAQDQNRQESNRNYRTGIEKYNVDALTSEVKRQDLGKFGNYQELMKGYAAGKTADATANSGGGGLSWICTEINKLSPFSKEDWNVLSNLRKYFRTTNPEVYKFYFEDHGNDLVHEMKKKGYDFLPLKTPIMTVIGLGADGNYSKAIERYWILTKVLCDIYAPMLEAPEFGTEIGIGGFMDKKTEIGEVYGNR